MKNPIHRFKHFIQKMVRRSSKLPAPKVSYTELTRRVTAYQENWGELESRSHVTMRKNFRAYLRYLTKHPSSTSAKHSRRTSPGTVDAKPPRTRSHTSERKITANNQSKLQENTMKLSKKLRKGSKVRWKKID